MRRLLIAAGIGATLCQLCSGQEKRLNVLIMLSDDQRAGTIHSLGNDQIITPNLDRLAAIGTSFTRAYIMGGSQGAVSVPSRAMLMTGKHLQSLEKTGTVIPLNHIMLGEYLRQNGYTVHGIGKWHNGSSSFARNFSSGGHIFFGGMSDQFNVLTWTYDSTGKYLKDSTRNQPSVIKGRNATELFTDDAVDFLARYDGKKPFMLYVAFTSPHDPRRMPEEYYGYYDTARISLPASFMPVHPFDNGEMKVRDELLAGFPRSKSEIKGHIRDYYAMITHLDAQVGRIISALENSKAAGNTLVVFAGDNGLALGQHGLMGKQNVYEHSVHVPLMIYGPGIPAGSRRESFCYLTDVYPTVCELCSLQIPRSVEGKSLARCIYSPESTIRKELYFTYIEYQRAVRDDRFKLIEYNVKGERHTQLFDLRKDPAELKNLSGDKEYAARVKEMRQKLLKLKSETADNGSFWNGIEFLN